MNEYSDSAMRRVIRRAQDGLTINRDEATVLLHARGHYLDQLCQAAASIRDRAQESVGRAKIITYSRKVFIPLTHLCRDHCHYCTFVKVPGKLHSAGLPLYLEQDEVLDIARSGAKLGCKEALFTLGDRPEDRWPEARQWLDERGYDSTLDYVRAMAIRVLEETGLLPHLNPGVMSWEEMSRLKPVAPSMGMMLETSSRRLFTEKGQAHYGSPDKDPAVRLQCLTDAGRLSVPMTSGVLIGIGETVEELAQSLLDMYKLHTTYGHLQEIIVQNFRAKPHTAMGSHTDADIEQYIAAVATTRVIFGSTTTIQAPPNLVSSTECLRLIGAGIDDWGGVSPLTPDYVNPERPWPTLDTLAQITDQGGYTLRERLTIHPKYIKLGQPWIDPRVMGHVRALAQPDGLANETAVPTGTPWQEPEEKWESQGRIDLQSDIDTHGRNTETRSDVMSAYGNWDVLREKVLELNKSTIKIDSDLVGALRRAEINPGGLSDSDYLAIACAEGDGLEAVTALADELRKQTVGDDVTYVINRNLNFTNICYTGCRFCAFAQRKGDADAYTLSTEEVADRVFEAHVVGATEICMQGGIDPKLPAKGYLELLQAIKSRVPQMHVHAYSPMEIVNGASRAGVSIRQWLLELKQAGLDSIPGTAAEILDDEVRWVLTKGKLPTQSWIDVITTAHQVGIPTTSTMMYGHVDNPSHWVTHLKVLRNIQDTTGGFTEFVPLPFVHHSAPLYLAGAARPGPTLRENRAVHALARIMLHGRINNIQTSWVKLGTKGTQLMLNGGANDLGGTLMEETISRMAGSQHGSAKTVAELHAIAQEIDRPAQQRASDYTHIIGGRAKGDLAQGKLTVAQIVS